MLIITLLMVLGTIDPQSCTLICEDSSYQMFSVSQPPLAEWPANGPWGGNVRCLATSLADNDIVVAGTYEERYVLLGGVWRSMDGGVTWSATELQGLRVTSVCAASPSTFYAATSNGLFVSCDDGETWSIVPSMSSDVIAIGVSPADPTLLIVGLASDSGIRRSTDGGATWYDVGLNEGFMTGFGIDPEHPDTMYVAVWGLDKPLYRSTDGGAYWAPMGPAGSGQQILVAPMGTGETIILTHDEGYMVTHDYGSTWNTVFCSTLSNAVSDGMNIYAPARLVSTPP